MIWEGREKKGGRKKDGKGYIKRKSKQMGKKENAGHKKGKY